MDALEISRFGPSALRIKFANQVDAESLARCRGLLAAIESRPPPGLLEIVPAYGEILLEFAPGAPAPETTAALARHLSCASPLPADSARLHEIPVTYDGEDLAGLAAARDLTPAELVALHSDPVYTVYQIGFSPGFPYLGPLDPRLHAPRFSIPRTHVPPGSVAIGGSHTGIYSVASPGGWHVIGHTAMALFSLRLAEGHGSEEAFLLRAGDRVKFVPLP